MAQWENNSQLGRAYRSNEGSSTVHKTALGTYSMVCGGAF